MHAGLTICIQGITTCMQALAYACRIMSGLRQVYARITTGLCCGYATPLRIVYMEGLRASLKHLSLPFLARLIPRYSNTALLGRGMTCLSAAMGTAHRSSGRAVAPTGTASRAARAEAAR